MRLLVLVLAGLALAPLASAQTEPAQPSLSLGLPFLAASQRIPVDGNSTPLVTPWSVDFLPGTVPPTGSTTLDWSLTCAEPGIVLTGPTVMELTFVPGTTHYEGDATFGIAAGQQTPGLRDLQCTVQADLAATTTTLAASNQTAFQPQADYFSLLQVKVPAKLKQSGPQKMIRYEVDIQNFGNAQTKVLFDYASRPGGDWQGILPEPVVVAPGGQVTAIFSVATPFDNGWNNDEAAFTLLAKPQSVDDPQVTGQDVPFSVLGRSRGWYIPGPELPLMGLALLAFAMAVRRRV